MSEKKTDTLNVRAKITQNVGQMVGYFDGRRIREGEGFVLSDPDQFSHNWMEAVGWEPPPPREVQPKAFEMRMPGGHLLYVTERKNPLSVDDTFAEKSRTPPVSEEPDPEVTEPDVPETEDEEEEITVDDVKKMTKQDLLQLIEDNELEVEASKSLKVLRERVIQALGNASVQSEE